MATQAAGMCSAQRISWSAIVTGALIGVGLSFLLNLFGVAIGLSAFSMSEEGASSLALGGLIGLIVSTIIAMFFAGFTAGHLGRLYVPKRNMSMAYGFTTWSVSIILSALLTTHVGGYVNAYSNNVTRQGVVVVDESSSNVSHKAAKMSAVTPKEISGGIALGAFIVFGLFFVGAVSSCIGARFGMSCREDN
jgi:hypothetical protein